jgi:hypothetical protein
MENAQHTPTLAAPESSTDNVVRLAEYRNRRKPAPQKTAQDWGPQYYCLRCDGDDFKLYASGVVHCTHCGSMMRNLLVNGSKAEEAP